MDAPLNEEEEAADEAALGPTVTDVNRSLTSDDVDLLVEFAPGQVPDLLGLSAIEIELSEALGMRVDLRTAQDLSPHFRDTVLREAQVAYAA